MNDDIEQLLGRLTPRGVRAELRPQVLAAVEGQLQAEPASPWLWRSAVAVAALLVLGIGMNIGVSEMSRRRMAQLFGPPPVSKAAMEVAKAVEEITDQQTARWVYDRLTIPRQSSDTDASANHYAMLQQLTNELEITAKGPNHETPQKDPQMDGDRPGRAGGDRSGCQRLLRVDYRYTA
jgi:hypothetical protein